MPPTVTIISVQFDLSFEAGGRGDIFFFTKQWH